MNANEWGLLAGTLVPLVVMLISKYVLLSERVKTWAAVIGSLILGAGTVYYSGGMDWQAIVTTILAIYGASQAAYRLVFRPLGWTAGGLLEAEERKALAAK
jgi:hypothetical protein